MILVIADSSVDPVKVSGSTLSLPSISAVVVDEGKIVCLASNDITKEST